MYERFLRSQCKEGVSNLFTWLSFMICQEISYSLQRMIRGVGASTSVSRTGFYTTLVAFLSLSGPEESVTVTHIFEVMEKQLHVGKGTSSEKVGRHIDYSHDLQFLLTRVFLCIFRRILTLSSVIF